MSAYSLSANTTSQTTPVLKKGKVKIFTTVSIYWTVGENPTASSNRCALLRAGEIKEINLPVSCSRVAVMAVGEPGAVTVTEMSGGAKASCSA